jgi:Fe-S-cluster containining protein
MMHEKLRIYFPFADGSLAYNCVECGFKCCKGHGFGATASEYDWLVARYPTMAYFTGPRDSREHKSLPLLNMAPRCYFQAGDGLCNIQVEHGREHKPIVCRTFPFNVYYRFKDTLIVTFHGLCPLRRWRPGSPDTQVHHHQIIEDLPTDTDRDLWAGDTNGRIFDDRLVDYEEWCRDLPVTDLLDLCAIFDATAAAVETRAPLAMPGPRAIAARRRALERHRQRILRFLRAESLYADSGAAPQIKTVAAHLRMRTLFAYPWLSTRLTCGMMGRMLVALEVLLGLAPRGTGFAPTLGGVVQLYEWSMDTLYLLANLGGRPRIAPLARETWVADLDIQGVSEPDAVAPLIQFIYNENGKGKWPLDRIFDKVQIAEPRLRLAVMRSLPRNTIHRLDFTHAPGA